jgi:hypothetical protein
MHVVVASLNILMPLMLSRSSFLHDNGHHLFFPKPPSMLRKMQGEVVCNTSNWHSLSRGERDVPVALRATLASKTTSSSTSGRNFAFARHGGSSYVATRRRRYDEQRMKSGRMNLLGQNQDVRRIASEFLSCLQGSTMGGGSGGSSRSCSWKKR